MCLATAIHNFKWLSENVCDLLNFSPNLNTGANKNTEWLL